MCGEKALVRLDGVPHETQVVLVERAVYLDLKVYACGAVISPFANAPHECVAYPAQEGYVTPRVGAGNDLVVQGTQSRGTQLPFGGERVHGASLAKVRVLKLQIAQAFAQARNLALPPIHLTE